MTQFSHNDDKSTHLISFLPFRSSQLVPISSFSSSFSLLSPTLSSLNANHRPIVLGPPIARTSLSPLALHTQNPAAGSAARAFVCGLGEGAKVLRFWNQVVGSGCCCTGQGIGVPLCSSGSVLGDLLWSSLVCSALVCSNPCSVVMTMTMMMMY